MLLRHSTASMFSTETRSQTVQTATFSYEKGKSVPRLLHISSDSFFYSPGCQHRIVNGCGV